MLIQVSKVEGEENKKEYKVTPKVSVQENKAVTVDVSGYTEPVEILPPEGKVAMEKVTLTLDNIPSGGATLYAWEDSRGTIVYCPFDVAPDILSETDNIMLWNSPLMGRAIISSEYWYNKVDDTNFQVEPNEEGDPESYTRNSEYDIILWQLPREPEIPPQEEG